MIINGNRNGEMFDVPPFVSDQARFVSRAGWQVSVGVVDDRTSVQGIVRNSRRLSDEIAAARPAVVHAQYGSVTAAIARVVAGRLPLVVSFCGDDLLGTPIPGVLWRAREQSARAIGLWGARDAAAIVVKSDNLRDALPRRLRGRATVLPNGVDTESFVPMDRASCRAALGWASDARIVLFNASHGGNQVVKNQPLARQVVDLVAASTPRVYLNAISGASRERMRLMMNAADCLLVTSFHEGSPNVVKEAMACNLPVVTVPCGDVAQRLSRTHPGAVSTYDAGGLAKAVIGVLESGSRSNGRDELIAQGLTALQVAERLTAIYRDASARNRRPPK